MRPKHPHGGDAETTWQARSLSRSRNRLMETIGRPLRRSAAAAVRAVSSFSAPLLDTRRCELPRHSENSLYRNAIANFCLAVVMGSYSNHKNLTGYQWDFSAAGFRQALLRRRRRICSHLGLQFRQGSLVLGSRQCIWLGTGSQQSLWLRMGSQQSLWLSDYARVAGCFHGGSSEEVSLFVVVDVLPVWPISEVWCFTCTLCNQPNGHSGFLLVGSGDGCPHCITNRQWISYDD